MFKKTPLAVVPALCALLIVLLLTVLRPAHTSDFVLGMTTGILLGLSIVSLVKLRARST